MVKKALIKNSSKQNSSNNKSIEELREKLLETARHLTKSLDLNKVLDQISIQARSLLDCKGITIYMLDEDGITLNPVLSHDPPFDKLVMSTKLNINKSLTGKTIKKKTGIIFNDTGAATGSFHIPGTPATDEDHVIISPFIVDNKAIGTMNLYRMKSVFTKDDLLTANTFAVYASTAIKNARNYENLKTEINERLLAEKEVILSEEKYHTLTENLNVGIYRNTPGAKGKFIEVNQAFLKIFGYKNKDSILNLNVSDLYETPSIRKKISDKVRIQGYLKHEEIRLKKKNGKPIICSVSSTAVKNTDGKTTFYDGIIEDITKRVALRNDLIANEKKYRSLTENLNVGIYRVTPGSKGKFIEVNKAFLDIFGYKNKTSLKNKVVSDFYQNPSDRKKLSEKFKSKGQIKNEEFRFVKKNGKPIICSDTAIAVRNKDGKIIHYDGIIEDITERVILRNKLIENEEKYRSLVDNSPDTIMRVNTHGVINYINYDFAGQNSTEIIGKTIYDLMPSEFHKKAKDALNKVIDSGRNFSYEYLGIGNKEEIIWYTNNVGPIKSNGNIVGATIIARDITERKQIDIMKTEFISSVSHELRTPLTIIRESISQVLDGLYGDPTEGQKDILSPCMKDISRLSRIIDNLLDISKIEGKKISINRDMVDIVKLVKNVLSSFKVKAEGKNIELKFKSSVKSIELFIDHDRIIQVVMNLIGNAIKFTEKGKIEVSIKKSENSIECCVSDTGRGIAHKDIATVFDRFHQVGKIISSTEKGTGLGLSISKGIVELHNGQIWLESQLNKGSQFYFKLPIYTTDEILFENIDKGIAEATKKHIKLSLLIIRLDNFVEIQKKSV